MDLRVCSRCEKVHGTGTTCPGCGSPLALADAASYFLGKEFGKYRVERLLGAGGMGVVYAARHATLNRPVALKLVQPGAADEAFLRRFLREAQILAELKHPNIVEVYDFDVSPWGPPYYVMEYLEGRTLRDVINHRGRDLVLADYAPLLRDLEAALSFAHRKGVVHRDFKPENVFAVSFGDRVVGKVLDFGIAKLLSEGSESTHLTATGAVMGTPNYLAPEQILLQPVGPATDQYAFAMVVAEMVAGRPIRAGKSLGEICSVEIRRPLPLQWPGRADLPEGLRAALHRATQPDPTARFSDVRAFVEALELPLSGPDSGKLAEAARQGHLDGTMELTPPGSGRLPSGPARMPVTTDIPPTPPPRTWAGTPPPTAASPARPPAPPASRVKKPLVWAGVACVALLAAAIGVPYLLRPGRPGTPSQTVSVASKPRPLLEEIGRIPLPADAREFLGHKVDEEVFLVAGPDCVYLLKSDTPATRVPLEKEQTVLGGDGNGAVWLEQGDALVLKDFVGGKSDVRARPLPPAQWYALSASGQRMVALAGRSVTVYDLWGGGTPRRLCGPWELPDPVQQIVLGDRYLVAKAGQSMIAYDLEAGRLLWSQPMPDPGILCLALEEARGLVAAGGRFDRIYLFELFKGGARDTIPRQGETAGLRFLPDSPTLAVAGDGGLKLWRSGGTGFLAESGAAEDRFRDLRFTGAALVVREDQTPRLRLFAYRGVGESRVVGVARKEIWALAEDPSGTSLYAGSSDGLLSVVDPKTGAVTAHPLHTQGLTALVAAKGALASSSDDKTITIWQTPAMSVLWRSKAHDYLINGLCLAEGEPPSLWSASSDGTVKRWGWPQLEEQESLETKVLLGRGFTLAALWASPAGDRVLAGTWNSALLDFTRGVDGRWTGRVLPVPSKCLYSAAALPAVGAVLFGGFGGQRPGVYLYDIRAGRLETLEDLGVPLYNAYVAAPSGGREACVAGVGSVLHYTFDRGPSGELLYAARACLDTDLGLSVSAAWLTGPDLLATGDPSGRVHLTGLSTLRGEPLFRSALPAGK